MRQSFHRELGLPVIADNGFLLSIINLLKKYYHDCCIFLLDNSNDKTLVDPLVHPLVHPRSPNWQLSAVK